MGADDAARDRYGRFSEDGREYIVTDPRTPRPWSNIISNERFGLAVSHTGSGFTWIDNSQLAVVNWWQQDFAQDTSGKFLYVLDRQSGRRGRSRRLRRGRRSTASSAGTAWGPPSS